MTSLNMTNINPVVVKEPLKPLNSEPKRISAPALQKKQVPELKLPAVSDRKKQVNPERKRSSITGDWKRTIIAERNRSVSGGQKKLSTGAPLKELGEAEYKVVQTTTLGTEQAGPEVEQKRSSLLEKRFPHQTSSSLLGSKNVVTLSNVSFTKVNSNRFIPQFGGINLSRKRKIRYICCYLKPKQPMLTPAEAHDRIHKLHRYCLIHLQDSYKVHVHRLKGIDLIEELIERTNIEELTVIQIMSIIWCILSCVHHFYIRLTVRNGFLAWIRRRQAKRAMRTYEQLISVVLPKHFTIVTRAIITFYSESKMWNTEYLCAELLKRLLYISQQSESAVHAILDIAEKTSLTNMREARQVIRVLYQVLENYSWTDMDEYLMQRLLLMYQRSVMPYQDDTDYVPLQKGLEVCLRHVIENVPSESLLKIIKIMVQWTFDERLTDEALLNFGNTLEYAAMLHQTYLFRDSLYQDLLPLLLQLVASENRLHSLLGNHVLQHLIDRHDNRGYFDTPKIFLDDIRIDIVVSQYNSEDKAFMRKYREMIHTALLASIQLHGIHRINLESTYTSIALFVVEIPCGYTAAAVVCLAMAIQEYALSDESLDLECSHRLHATVMAVMSLVCWVHSAQVFYDYLRSVVSRRAQYAPHLNPPLRATYQYAQHHVLWNKPELFFEDWEARYGLWKCFRTRRTRHGTIANFKQDRSVTEL